MLQAAGEGLKPLDEKQRVCLILGIIGTPFAGMQEQVDNANTIEAVLNRPKGLFETIAIDPTRPGKLGYTRAARTDKGVSAACQVVTLNCRAGLCTQKTKARGGNETAIATGETLAYLNGLLANEHIRVLHVTQCANDFDARRHCERRVYEYLVPCTAFGDLDEAGLAAKRKVLKKALGEYRGTHIWRNFTRRSNPVLADNQLQRHIFRAGLGENVMVTPPGDEQVTYWLITLSGEAPRCLEPDAETKPES